MVQINHARVQLLHSRWDCAKAVGGRGADTNLRGLRLAVHGAHGLDEGGQDGDHLNGYAGAMEKRK